MQQSSWTESKAFGVCYKLANSCQVKWGLAKVTAQHELGKLQDTQNRIPTDKSEMKTTQNRILVKIKFFYWFLGLTLRFETLPVNPKCDLICTDWGHGSLFGFLLIFTTLAFSLSLSPSLYTEALGASNNGREALVFYER